MDPPYSNSRSTPGPADDHAFSSDSVVNKRVVQKTIEWLKRIPMEHILANVFTALGLTQVEQQDIKVGERCLRKALEIRKDDPESSKLGSHI